MPISPLFSKYSISCYFFPLFSNANSVYRLQNYELFPEVRHIPQNIYSFLITFAEQTTENGNVYGDGFFNIAIDVNRVDLKETETMVSVTVNWRSDYDAFKFKISSGTYLLADGKKYSLLSADGIELDKSSKTNDDNKRDIVFHFQPLPLNTKVLDFIEGESDKAFKICGIRPIEERQRMLFPSYWRNQSTGNVNPCVGSCRIV